MPATPPTTPPDSSNDPASATETLSADVQRKFDAIRRWQFVSRGVSVATVVVVAGMFAAFARTTYDGVNANFTDTARTQRAVEAAVPRISPVVIDSLQAVLVEAAPVYQQLAAERYQRVRENLGTTALIRLHKLPEESGRLMADRLSSAFERVLAKIEPDLRATFPSLTDAQRRDLLVDYFGRMIEERNRAIAGKIDAVRVTEMARIEGILAKFELPPDDAGPADDQLRKELVRTMVLLAEQELIDLEGASPVNPGRPDPVAGTAEPTFGPNASATAAEPTTPANSSAANPPTANPPVEPTGTANTNEPEPR